MKVLHPVLVTTKSKQVNASAYLDGQIIQFFKDNPNPNDQQVHHFAKSVIGIRPEEFERHIYRLFTKMCAKH